MFSRYFFKVHLPYTTAIEAGTFSLVDYEAGVAEPECTHSKSYARFLFQKIFLNQKKPIKTEP